MLFYFSQRRNLLSRTPNIADPLSKTPTKAKEGESNFIMVSTVKTIKLVFISIKENSSLLTFVQDFTLYPRDLTDVHVFSIFGSLNLFFSFLI